VRKFPTPLLGKFLCNFGDFLLAKNIRCKNFPFLSGKFCKPQRKDVENIVGYGISFLILNFSIFETK